MNTKKVCAFTSAGLVAGLALTLVLVNVNRRKGFSPLNAQDPQTLVFNSESNVLGNSEGSTEIETLKGNKIGFTFSRLYLLEDHWQRMISNGYFYNTTPLSGMTSLKMYFTGTAPTVMYGYDIDGEIIYNLKSGHELESGVAFDFGGASPDYIKVSSVSDAENLDIESMTISYACERTAEKDLRNLDVYADTPVAGGEGDANNNKGKIYYWHDDSASITNATISAGVFSFDHTKGNPWYDRQIFYSLPYGQTNDAIRLRTTVTSSVAGTIQLNGHAYELEADTPKLISINTYVGENGLSLSAFNLQFGTPSVTQMASGHFSMTLPTIYSKAVQYHEVLFKDGLALLSQDYVRDGKTLNTIPEGPTKAGYIFQGWFDSSDVKLTASTVIEDDTIFFAKFIEESLADKYTVTFINADDISETYSEQVVKTLSPKGDVIECPFSYSVFKYYTDAGKTNEVQLANLSITENTDIYYTLKVDYLLGHDDWATFENSISWSEEGYLKMNRACSTYPDPTTDSYHIQISFGPLPNDSELSYDITFTYDIAVEGAYYKIYNDDTHLAYGQGAMDTGDDQTLTISYLGADIPDGTRLEFGFGAMKTADDIKLVVKSVVVTAVSI